VNREKKEGCGCVWSTAAATVPRRTAVDGCCCGDDDGWHGGGRRGGGRRLRGTAADGCCCTAADGATAGVGYVGRLLRSSCGGRLRRPAARTKMLRDGLAGLERRLSSLLRHACL